MNIVCFHLNQVGDLIFSLPALKCLRDSFPGSIITSVVRPSQMEILESTGLVDFILPRGSQLNRKKLRLFNQLRSKSYDLAITFSQSAECAFLAYMSGAPKRVGFINTSLGSLLNHHIDFNHPPSTENNLRLVTSIGGQVSKCDYSNMLKLTSHQIERADKILAEHGIASKEPIVAFAPGTSGRRSIKEWTDEGYAELGRHLISNGIRVVILGTVPSSNIVEDCSQIIDLSGKTNLGEVAAILHKCKALVAVDSGVLHLGAAAGTRVVGLYGPSNPNITGPQGEGHKVLTSGAECSPCVKTECVYGRKCMIDLKAEDVIAAVDQILNMEAHSS